ncbi:transposase [Candidatus Poribacteria bacterium]|nr:transposase [Candidatus Poribacteria bacterium]MYG05837.1 transposase [Candidatus Poribacteria bacterium]MYK25050.1 transposase [Candidatus Poribacteria bacterium]
MRLTFQYPVYPTKTQETTLLGWFDHLCELQNSARHDRLVAYETEGVFVSLSDQQTLLTQAREKYDDFRAVPQDFQNHTLRRTDKAFAAFRKRCKNGDAQKGYPRHKKRVRSLTWSLRKYSKVVRKKTKDTDKFHQVDPKNTSQTCSCCGQKSPEKLSLSVKTFSCQSCGLSMDRDHNAAINILLRAACAHRGERWVTDLYEARNMNEARDAGLENARQLLLFDELLTSPSL